MINLANKKIALLIVFGSVTMFGISAVLAVKSSRNFFNVTAAKTELGSVDLKKIKLETATANPQALSKFEGQVKAEYPMLEVFSKGDSLVIASKSKEDYENWFSSLHLLPSLEKGYVFRAKQLCIGKCDDGFALSASIQATSYVLTVQ